MTDSSAESSEEKPKPEKRAKHKVIISWSMFIVSLIGFVITFPLWLLGVITERTMIGITLALSWAALWYEGYNAIQLANEKKEQVESS